MIGRSVLRALLIAVGARGASGQISVDLRDPGAGRAPQVMARALDTPHFVIAPASSAYLVRRDTAFGQTLIVLGRDAIVEGTIHGDLIVVAGDLYMHPGGRIDGRAVAIGGGAYESTLASVGGDLVAYRDFTYDIAQASNGYTLRYRSFAFSEARGASLAGLYGLVLPTYDRSNGLSIPLGVDLTVPDVRLRFEPRITYRSQLGRLDPWLTITDTLTHGVALIGSAGRSTFSNETWINSDLINSLTVLAAGNDTRNYFRAKRAEAKIAWRTDSAARTFTNYVGVRGEKSSSIRPDTNVVGGPWAFRGRHDVDDMLRPNPRIEDGSIASVLAGSSVQWESEGVVARGSIDLELGRAIIDPTQRDNTAEHRRFVQATFDGAIDFPTFGLQSLRFEGHAVATSPGNTPRQRWAYLGGSGTLSPLELLELGGDQLIYIDARYNIPLTAVHVPVIEPPTLTLRDALGGAAFRGAPTIHQAVGVRLSLSVAYVELMIDPATRHRHFGFGFSLSR